MNAREKKSAVLNVKVTKDTKNKLEQRALKRDITLSQLIREAIVKNNKKQ